MFTRDTDIMRIGTGMHLKEDQEQESIVKVGGWGASALYAARHPGNRFVSFVACVRACVRSTEGFTWQGPNFSYSSSSSPFLPEPFALCLVPFAFCLLPFAFCLWPFAFLPFAFCLPPAPQPPITLAWLDRYIYHVKIYSPCQNIFIMTKYVYHDKIYLP